MALSSHSIRQNISHLALDSSVKLVPVLLKDEKLSLGEVKLLS